MKRETQTVEFKQSWRDEYLEWICGYANAFGGTLFCSVTDSDIAKYSMLHGNEQLFATKYRLCLPSDAELRKEIETQKQLFIEQHGKGS